MLTVTIYADAEAIAARDGTIIEVDFVSLVNDQTYGPPALVAPAVHGRDTKRAEPGEEVLYLNTHLIPAFKIREDEDDA